MKKTIVTIVISFITLLSSHAQIDWGLKGGLNFNSNGDITHEVQDIIQNYTSKSNSSTGFHLGIFATTNGSIFVRPELSYTHIKSDYIEGGFTMSKLDMPLLAGIKIFEILNVFAGPSLQYILNTDLDGIKLSDVEKDFTIGLNIGTGIKFGNLGIDIRYERAFTSNEATFLNVENYGRIDTRPEQLILSLSVKM